MYTLQPLLAFAETAKRGNFAAAARELACTPSTLAKAVSRLEADLGVRLFHRTTRRVALTDDGERLFDRCRRVLAELDLLQEEASGTRQAPSGTLRIDMPVSLGRMVILPHLARLEREYPALAIDARFSDAYVDLVKDGIDVAIRTGPLRDSSLVARQIGSQELLLFAAPSYLERAGRPRTLSELEGHTAVLFRVPSTGRERPWNFRAGSRNVDFLPKSRVRVDQGDALVQAAVQGMGLGQVPHYMVTGELESGALVELLPSLRPTPMPIWAVMPSSRLIPQRVRALLDLIQASPDAVPRAHPIPRASPVRRARVTARVHGRGGR
jgi:LysR family transcriptional regulator, regulator for bpeEF and oprC